MNTFRHMIAIGAALLLLVGGGCGKRSAADTSGAGLMIAPDDTTDRAGREPVVRARFSTDSIMLGDRFGLEVEVGKDLMQEVTFPEFDRYLGDSIEIVHEGPVDTVVREGRRMVLRRAYTLTCFEPAIYNVGRFPVLYLDKNIVDTIWSRDSLVIAVHTIPIDTVSQQIYDIKPQIDAPLRFGEFSGYLFRILIGLILLGLIIAGLLRRFSGRSLLPGPKTPPEPPHVVAIRELEKLDHQKLWQSGKHKAYYTGLTDILRHYLEGRYGFSAMEQTSAETLASLIREEVPEHATARLRSVLGLADLVKFAKLQPDPEQNTEAYADAYYFVEETKATEEEEPAASDAGETGKEDAP